MIFAAFVQISLRTACSGLNRLSLDLMRRARDLCTPHKDTKSEFEQKVTKFTKNREKVRETLGRLLNRPKEHLRQYAGEPLRFSLVL